MIGLYFPFDFELFVNLCDNIYDSLSTEFIKLNYLLKKSYSMMIISHGCWDKSLDCNS